MRFLRYLVRVPLLAWHVFVHLPVTLLLMAPPFGQLRLAGGGRLHHRMVRLWSGGLMRVFGMRVRRVGHPMPGAVMFVANHVSWIDIATLHSQRMMGFVAKREIAGWPGVGWLASRAATIYHQRGSQESLGGVLHEMLARLRDGRAVGVFPEGRTRDGREVGPFHARIFLAAVAFAPGESFFGNFVRLLGEPARPVEVVILAPIQPGDAEGRRRIADIARERIVAAMAA